MDAVEHAQFSLRPARADDLAFIFATWLKSYYFGNPDVEEVPQEAYYAGQHKVIEQLLERCTVILCCPVGDYETILGWAVYERPGTLHYVYVKGAFRRLGVAKTLLAEISPMQYFTHRTGALSWFKAKEPTAKYNPFAIHQGATNGKRREE